MSGDLVCVYRCRNAGLVAPLVSEAVQAGLRPVLWGLDGGAPELTAWTVGTGPGSRLSLLNRLLAAGSGSGVLVVTDDDVSFVQGSLKDLLSLTRRAGLSLAQPAHAPGSVVNHGITEQRPNANARLTRFVEIGPVVVVAEGLRSTITPFPEEFGMGWGLDIVWSDLRRKGCRLGVVDAVSIRHHGVTAVEYETQEGEQLIADLLADRAIPSMGYFDQTIRSWHAWQPVPLWVIPGLSWYAERRIPGWLRRLAREVRRLAGRRRRPA